MLESVIENKAVQFAKANGILTYKFTSPSSRGVPDRIFLREGHVLFIEFKAPGKKPTALQIRELKRIRATKHFVVVVDSWDDALAMLRWFAQLPVYR